MMERSILNFTQAVEYLGVSKSTLYKLTHSRGITFYKPGGKLIYFRKEDLDKWLLGNPMLSGFDSMLILDNKLAQKTSVQPISQKL